MTSSMSSWGTNYAVDIPCPGNMECGELEQRFDIPHFIGMYTYIRFIFYINYVLSAIITCVEFPLHLLCIDTLYLHQAYLGAI